MDCALQKTFHWKVFSSEFPDSKIDGSLTAIFYTLARIGDGGGDAFSFGLYIYLDIGDPMFFVFVLTTRVQN